eukprot:1281285-Rhodomonas_salina.1
MEGCTGFRVEGTLRRVEGGGLRALREGVGPVWNVPLEVREENLPAIVAHRISIPDHNSSKLGTKKRTKIKAYVTFGGQIRTFSNVRCRGSERLGPSTVSTSTTEFPRCTSTCEACTLLLVALRLHVIAKTETETEIVREAKRQREGERMGARERGADRETERQRQRDRE